MSTPPTTAGSLRSDSVGGVGRALVTAEVSDAGLARLARLGYQVHRAGWGATGQTLRPAELLAAAAGAELLVTEVEPVDAAVLEVCPGLRAVAAARGTPSNVDVTACTDRGVPVLHAPGRNAASVADFTLGLILAVARRIVAGAEHLRRQGWHVVSADGVVELPYLHFRGPELAGRALGLIGYGAVGQAVARRAAAGFGMRVVYCDPNVAGSLPLEELLGAVDVVSLHCPRGPETERLIRYDTLALMRPGTVLVNTAGGACADGLDVLGALRSGQLAGAALDVFATEPLPADDPLRAGVEEGLNLLLTPHLAGAADDVVAHHSDMLCADIEALHAGHPPRYCANPSVLSAAHLAEGAATRDARLGSPP